MKITLYNNYKIIINVLYEKTVVETLNIPQSEYNAELLHM